MQHYQESLKHLKNTGILQRITEDSTQEDLFPVTNQQLLRVL